jgi:hypothetical protein
MAQAPPLTVIFHGSIGAYREDGQERTLSWPWPMPWHAQPAPCYFDEPIIYGTYIIDTGASRGKQ